MRQEGAGEEGGGDGGRAGDGGGAGGGGTHHVRLGRVGEQEWDLAVTAFH